jgi:hypothetical protein
MQNEFGEWNKTIYTHILNYNKENGLDETAITPYLIEEKIGDLIYYNILPEAIMWDSIKMSTQKV